MIQVDLQIFYQKKHGFNFLTRLESSQQAIVESWAQKVYGGSLQDNYKLRPYQL